MTLRKQITLFHFKHTMTDIVYDFSGKDTDSSAVEEEGDDFKALEAKLRCMAIKKKPSQGNIWATFCLLCKNKNAD